MRKFLYSGLAAIAAFVLAVVLLPTNAYSQAVSAPVPFSLKASCGPTTSAGWCTATHNLGVVPQVIQAQTINYTAIVTTRNWTANTVQVRLSKRINLDGTVDNWVGITVQVSLFGMYVPATVTPTPSTTTPSTTPSASPSTSPTPSVTPSTNPPVGDYPTATTTGVPAGTALAAVSGDVVVNEANTVIDGKKISGDVSIRAAGAVIKNSEIAGRVINDDVPSNPSFTIQDSQVGSSANCSASTGGAIGTKNYTATRVKLVGYVDGFRIAGGNVLIQDSFVKLCGNNPDYHSDGIQAYGAADGKNIVIKHNVIDQSSVIGEAQTAPIFIPNDHAGQGNQNIEVTVDDNVLLSGSYSLRVFGDLPFSAPSVSGNKIVDGLWGYGPVDVTCSKITKWERNAVVTYDVNTGKILSEVRSLDAVC
jgi:hypothetical protein